MNQPVSLSALWPFLRPYRLRIFCALLFLVLAAAATLAFPVTLRSLIDSSLVIEHKGEQLAVLQQHFAALFAVALALGVFSAARYYTVSWLGERVSADIRNAVYHHVLQQSPVFFETTQTGEVLSRLTNDTTLVQTVVGSSLSMGLRNAVMGIGALSMLIYTNPILMIQVLLVLVLIVLPALWIGRRVRKLSRASQDRVADASAIAAEVLNAIPVVQSYTAQEREAERFRQSTGNAFDTAIKRTKARAALVAFIIVATSAGLIWGLYLGTQAVLEGRMTAGHLGQTIIYIIILAGSFAVLGEVYGDLLRAAGATERLIELLHHQSPITSPIQPVALPQTLGGSTVQWEDVSFCYPSRPDKPALQQLSLDIRAGQTIAIVGPSGAGKSTLFQLLLRFYTPQSGRIMLDGIPIEKLNLNTLRGRIGLVPQDPVIFSSTALENIRYGKPDASDEAVYAAAHAAFAHDFISALPQGYQTFLGERGLRLSGGQRQRIAIARAILKNPPLLLLDEATSALDAESERMVQAALESAMQNRTTLVIAHRLATIQKADNILVIDHGRLVEHGTHAELIAAGGVYAGLAALQFAPNSSPQQP